MIVANTCRTDVEASNSKNGLDQSIMARSSSSDGGHATDATEASSASSSSSSSSKAKYAKDDDTTCDPLPPSSIQEETIIPSKTYDQAKSTTTTTLVVGTHPPTPRRIRSSITQFLCCVNESDAALLGKYAASDGGDGPFPAAYASTTVATSWTERTRRSFERNIEALLSTCDYDSSRGGDNKRDSSGVDGVVWSASYEKRYRTMVQEGMTNLGREEAEKEEEDEQANKPDEAIEPPAPVISSLTALRRGFSPRARTTRLRMLRRKMTPSSSEGATKKAHLHHGFYKKTQSFDDRVLRQERSRSRLTSGPHRHFPCSASTNREEEEKKKGSTALSRVFEGACQCGTGDNLMPLDGDDLHFGDRSLLSDDDAAYDSDPELCQSRKSMTFTESFPLTASRSVSKEDDTTASVSDDEEDTMPEESSTEDAADTVQNSINYEGGLNLLDEEQTSKLIEEIIHRSMTLIWHPPKSKDNTLKNGAYPTCVKAWIELGCRVKGQIIQPKLVWRNAYHHRQGVNNAVVATMTPHHPLGSIDVLDISRVLTTSEVDRNEFPLAMKNRSFSVLTSDQTQYLFEVADRGEMDRIVLSLKLLVARLASLIIVGDQQIFDDFFYPSSSSDFQRKYDIEE